MRAAAKPLDGLEPEVPIVERIFLAGQARDFVQRKRAERGSGVPGPAEGGLDAVGGDVEVDQEIGVGPVDAIVRLAGGHGQDLLQQPEIEVQQE